MKKAVLMTLVLAAMTVGVLVGCDDKKAAPAPAAGAKSSTPAPATPPAGGEKK
jgi:hypothetical protein